MRFLSIPEITVSVGYERFAATRYIDKLEETRFAYIVEVDGDNLQVNARPPEGQ